MENESDVGSSTQPDANTSEPSASFAVPEEYKEEGWTQNIKSYDDLWKMNANAQKMIGKKSLLPGDDSSDEEWDGFYSKMRPEKQEDYNLSFEDADEKAFFEKAFFESGISKKQAAAIANSYKEAAQRVNAEMYSKQGYDQVLNERFGDKAKDVAGKVTSLLSKELDEQDQKAIEAMPNNIIGVVYGVVNKLMDRYAIKDSDTAALKGASGNPGQPDYEGYVKAVQDLSHRPHTTADMANLKTKYNIK